MTSHATFKNFFSQTEINVPVSLKPQNQIDNLANKSSYPTFVPPKIGLGEFELKNQKSQINFELENHFRILKTRKLNCKRLESLLNEQFFDNNFQHAKICQKYVNSVFFTSNNKKSGKQDSVLSTDNSESVNFSSLYKKSDNQKNTIDFLLKQAYQKYKENFYSKSEPQKSIKNFDSQKNKSIVSQINSVSGFESSKSQMTFEKREIESQQIPTTFRLSIDESTFNFKNKGPVFSKQLNKRIGEDCFKINRDNCSPVSCSVIFERIEESKKNERHLMRKVYRVC